MFKSYSCKIQNCKLFRIQVLVNSIIRHLVYRTYICRLKPTTYITADMMIFKFRLIYLTWMFALFSVISVILLQLIWIRDLCQSNFTPADGCKNFKLLVVIEIRFLKNFRKDRFLISEQFVSLVIRYCLGCDFFSVKK